MQKPEKIYTHICRASPGIGLENLTTRLWDMILTPNVGEIELAVEREGNKLIQVYCPPFPCKIMSGKTNTYENIM